MLKIMNQKNNGGYMKKSELRLMIRKIVREEVAMSIQEVIKEITQPVNGKISKSKPIRKKIVEKKQYTNNSVLNDVLNETAKGEDWKTMGGDVLTSESRNGIVSKMGYGDLMNDNSKINVEQMAVDANVNPTQVPDHVGDALTRDYSDLMKAMKKNGMKQ